MRKFSLRRLLGAAAIAGSLAFASGAATEAKAEGGTFVWGISSEMSILDPHVACGWLTTNAIHSIFEGLVMLDLSEPNAKNAKLKPAIAESWTVNDDGTVYTFAIRENVRFHDGTSVDADVVKWNYDRFMNTGAEHAFDQAQAYLGYYTRWIKSVEVTGPMTVKITLNETNYEWLQMGVVACGMPMIASPTAIQEMGNEQFALTPVGTGPFKFVEREQNIKLVMERNDDYWGDNAKIERLIFQPLPDQATRLNAIRAGEVSMIMEAPWEELENLKNEGFTVTTNENIPSIWLLFFNHKDPIMQDVRVRKAINMSIDRGAIADGILKGTGRAEMGMLSPGTYAYKPGYAPIKHDPEGAKALLAEAGYPNGLDLEFDIYEYGYNEVWEKSIQRDLKKVGINAKLNKIEWITYMGKWLQGMPDGLQMNEIGWGWTIPFWTQVMTRCDYHPPNGFNVGWYCNPEVDKLFDEAVKQKDKAKAAALYQQANDIIIGQDFGYAVKFTYQNPLVLSPSVKHFVNPPANWYDFSIIELE